MRHRAALPVAALAVLAVASLAACSPSSSSSASAPAASARPASAVAASHAAGTTEDSPAAAASAKACAELDAWQKKHGNSVTPPQAVFNDLINTPQPLSGDFTAWDLAAGTNQPDAEADLLKVWTDCAKAEAAALGG